MIRRLKYFLLISGALTLAACSAKTEYPASDNTPYKTVKMMSRVKSAQDYTGTSVLVFRKENGTYGFVSKFDGPWSDKGHATAILELGDYKFLFFRSPSIATDESELVTGTTTPEEFGFTARQDAGGNILPVDEIFLPTEIEAETEYHIDDNTTVNSYLTRAVSRVNVRIKRGIYDGTTFTELPYTNGKTVLDQLDNLELQISGVGTGLNVKGTTGSGSTVIKFTPSEATEITSDGFARFKGPLVFPPANNGNVSVNAVFTPKAGSPFPELTGSVTYALLKNQRLEVTLWITNDYKFIDITAETRPIEAETEGDNGIWQ